MKPKKHLIDRRAADVALAGALDGKPDDLLSTVQLAQWLGVSVQFLEIGRHRGYGPKFITISAKRIRYRRSDVMIW